MWLDLFVKLELLREAYSTFPWQPRQIWNLKDIKLQRSFLKYHINTEGGIGNQDILVNISFAYAASKYSLVSNPPHVGSHTPEGVLTQILAMPLSDQVGKAAGSPTTYFSRPYSMFATIQEVQRG